MKAIYFGKGENNTFEKYGKNLVEWSTGKFSESFPSTSIKLSEKLLCTPTRNARPMPVDFEVHELEIQGYKIKLYSKGESEKAILLVHGWSGAASNFKSYYKQALADGYSVWAMDHVGHGESEGKYANFFLFIDAVRASFNYMRARTHVEAVVGHSMGGSAIISAGLPTDVKTVFLAPVVPFFENMYDVVTKVGISEKMLDQLIKHFENKFSMSRAHLSPMRRWKQFKNPKIIFHDVEDRFIPLEKNLKVWQSDANLNLNITNGLGHFRILKDSAVIHQTLEFIKGETN